MHGGLELAANTSFTADCRALNIVGEDGNTNMPTICIIDAGATVTHGNGDDVAVFVRGSASKTRDFWGAWAILDVYGTLIDAATTPGQYGITGNGGNATLAEINFYDGSVYTFADTTRPMMWLSSNDLNLYGGTLTSAGGGILVLCGKVNVPADSTVTANGPAGTYVSYSGNDYTSLLTVDPTLHIDAIEQTETGWTITVSASADETAIPLSDAITGTLKVRYAADLATGSWTDATYTPTFANGTATVTVTAEGAKFIKAVITK